MPIIPEERNRCCCSFRCHECFSCWPQHSQGQRILGKPCLIKRAAPSLQGPAPSHLQSVCPTPPTPLGTHCTYTSSCGFFQVPTVPSSAHPLCRWESRAAGDKGNTAPILWSPIQEARRERLQTVKGSLLQRPSPGWPGWELATGPAGGIHTMDPRHADILPGHMSPTRHNPSTERSSHLSLAFFFPHSHFLTPDCLSRNPKGKQRVGAGASPFPIRNRGKTNDVVQLFTTFVQYLQGRPVGLKIYGAKKMLKQQKVRLPKTAESLNQKFTMGFSWQGEPQWNNGEIVLTLRM